MSACPELDDQIDIERFFAEVGGEIGEVRNLTREVIIPRDGRAPLLLLRIGLSSIARRRAIASCLFTAMYDRIDHASAIAVWRTLFAGDLRPAVATVLEVDYSTISASVRRWFPN